MNSQEKKEAYNYVFDDLISNYGDLFRGKYDAKNGSASFMYGIWTVMDVIAHNAKKDEVLNALFFTNMQISEDRVKNKNGNK